MALRTSLAPQPHLYMGDMQGRPLDAGKVYFGQPNKDPEIYPINVFYDEALTIAATQPIRTMGGFMNANGQMVEIYAAETTYSVKVLDGYGRQVFYQESMTSENADLQAVKFDTGITATAKLGGVERTLADINATRVHVADFGATGSGSDESSKIQAAINYADSIGGAVVEFAGKTYNMGVNGQLIGKDSVSLQGIKGATVLDYRNSDPYIGQGANSQRQLESYIQYKGVAKSGVSRNNSDAILSTDMLKGSNQIVVPNSDVFKVGDLIEISANTSGIWIDTIATRIGQLTTVTNIVNATTITISDYAEDSYTVLDSASIRIILPMSNFFVRGLTILASDGVGSAAMGHQETKGIGTYFCRDFDVSDNIVLGCFGWSIRPTSCLNFEIKRNRVQISAESRGLSGAFYGIPYASGNKSGVIDGNEIIGYSSGIISSHTSQLIPEQYVGINRDISIGNKNVINVSNTGISTHQDAERISISHNDVFAKGACIRVRTKNIAVTNNNLRVSSASGNAVLLSHQPESVTVTDNQIYGTPMQSGIAIYLTTASLLAGFIPKNIKVDRNTITDFNSDSHIISMDFPRGTSAISLGNSVSDNTISNVKGGVGASVIYVRGKTSLSIMGNKVNSAEVLGGIRLSDEVTMTNIRTNRIFNIGGTVFTMGTTTGTGCRVVSNELGGYAQAGSGTSNLAEYTGNIEYGAALL